jgi:hypothetical protein
VHFRYSLYFELFDYALWEWVKAGSRQDLEALVKGLHPRARRDKAELRRYLLRSKNFVEPFMSDFYDQYMKLNEQPKGRATYNEVIAWLIAFMKKNGTAAI